MKYFPIKKSVFEKIEKFYNKKTIDEFIEKYNKLMLYKYSQTEGFDILLDMSLKETDEVSNKYEETLKQEQFDNFNKYLNKKYNTE
jgi:hypothetical protein